MLIISTNHIKYVDISVLVALYRTTCHVVFAWLSSMVCSVSIESLLFGGQLLFGGSLLVGEELEPEQGKLLEELELKKENSLQELELEKEQLLFLPSSLSTSSAPAKSKIVTFPSGTRLS